jgi:hypothetical protein
MDVISQPTSIEFSLLEEIVISPFRMNQILKIVKICDRTAVRQGHEEGYASDCFRRLLNSRALEVLDEAGVAYRQERIAEGPSPIQSIRNPGSLDVSLLGGRMYELGRQVYAKNPDRHKVTLYSYDDGHVRCWKTDANDDQEELPGSVLHKIGGVWRVKPSDGHILNSLVVRENVLWRDRWWEDPRLGVFVEYYLVRVDPTITG